MLLTASGAPKGCSLETTRWPFGATVRSSGLSPGSATKRGVRTVPPQSNTTIVLSLAGRSDARRETEPAAAGKPEPARERDDTIGQKRFRAAVKGGGHFPVSSAESPTRAVYRSIRQARSSSSTAATTARWRLLDMRGAVVRDSGRVPA